MRTLPVLAAAVLISLAGSAFAQMQGGVHRMDQSSANANGVQIQGNTTINANARDVNTSAIGEGNTAKTVVGGIGK